MRCYYVLVHGELQYHLDREATGLQSKGFVAARCLFARNAEEATFKAFAKVTRGLAERNADIRDGLISVKFEAEEVEVTNWWNAFRRFNRSHAFYQE